MGKIAVKRLTGSDLTLFEWHFRNHNAGNQKSINLNADVFIDVLYPSLPSTDPGRVGRIPIDLFLFGPGNARAWNLQRKIIKGSTYKNWRLNGEYISDPMENPTRFHSLVPGDYAIFDFEGELYPSAARIVFVAKNVAEDANLHRGLFDAGIGSMAAMELPQLRLIVHASGTLESHPVYELLLDAAIEDASQGGLEGIRRLQSRTTGRRMTRSELERARQKAEDVGRDGEEMLNGYLSIQQTNGVIEDYDWFSSANPMAPYDFSINGGSRKIDAKSTEGDFGRVLHVSINQLYEMQQDTPYDLYRIYAMDDLRAKLRIASDVKTFADRVLKTLDALPQGVTVDSISIHPDEMSFGNEIDIDLTSLENGEPAAPTP